VDMGFVLLLLELGVLVSNVLSKQKRYTERYRSLRIENILSIPNSRGRLIIKVWRIHYFKLKKYASILDRYSLFAGN